MSRLPLSGFLKNPNRQSIINLVEYMTTLKSKNRYSSKECIEGIKIDSLRDLFCEMALKKFLYPKNDYIHDYVKSKISMRQNKANKNDNYHKRNTNRPKIIYYPNSEIALTDKGTTKVSGNGTSPKKRKIMIDEESSSKSHAAKVENNQLKTVEKSHSNANTTIHSVVKNVSPSEFLIHDGKIVYKCHLLKSDKIKSVDSDALSLIERKFDLNLMGKSFVSHFNFSPASDLDVLLQEIQNVKSTYKYKMLRLEAIKAELESYPKDGWFYLPWKYVKFFKGNLHLIHPNPSKRGTMNPYIVRHNSILRSFGDILSYIERNCAQLHVLAHDGVIVDVDNFKSFSKKIPQIIEDSNLDLSEVEFARIYPIVGNGYSIDEFRRIKFKSKSPYISLLAKHHLDKYRIYYLKENVVHASQDLFNEEFGYLFAFKEVKGEVILVYENITDESRSSYVLWVYKTGMKEAVEYISRFLASDLDNKRLKLATGELKLKSPFISKFQRLSHSNFEEWRKRMLNL